MTKAIHIKNIMIGKGLPKICVPIMGTTLEQLREDVKAVSQAAPDVVEWRADYFEALDDFYAVKEAGRMIQEELKEYPLIFTVRTVPQGGKAEIDPKEYTKLLKMAAVAQLADIIDVEILEQEVLKKDLIDFLHEHNIKAIGSFHDFTDTPPKKDMYKILQKADAAGADILKLAVMPKTLFDVWELLEVTNSTTVEHTEKPIVTIAMGDLGSLSRFSGEIFGSALTFATIDKQSAPGQLPIEELREMMNLFHKNTD
ncbi:MAG: type I 3-dehydroquinate dehydratase [Lachnospiraceae bacterium]